MPPVTPAEKLEAEQSLPAKQRQQAAHLAGPAVATEVARRRILRGDYGELTPKNNHVNAAGDDLGLSVRQRKELRKQLLEAIPVRTLENFYEKTDAAPRADLPPLQQPLEQSPLEAWQHAMAACRAEIDAALPPTVKRDKLELDQRRYCDECIQRMYDVSREEGERLLYKGG